MAELFGHEKLIVYQKGMRFAVFRSTLLAGLPKRVAACDHLDRGAESILINIAHASNLWAPKERIVYLGHANGSALECAACLDVFGAKNLMSAEVALPGKLLLSEGTGRFSGRDQAKFFGIAYKAAILSSALVDLAAVSESTVRPSFDEGREMLRSIAAMLTSLSKVASREA